MSGSFPEALNYILQTATFVVSFKWNFLQSSEAFFIQADFKLKFFYDEYANNYIYRSIWSGGIIAI